ncbi:MAG: hypothetical protein ACO3K7_02865 [Candidatus Marinamargulisbacteria bacterium]
MMSKKNICIGLLGILLSSGVMADALVSISGNALSGISMIKQKKGQSFRGQFESAANITIGLKYTEEIDADFDLALGNEKNALGFENGVGFARYRLNYRPNAISHTSFTLGSTVVPFGQFAESQTRNAAISSPFMANDLGYTLFALNNPLNRFQSNGVKTTSITPYGTVNAMVFNGTDGSDTNTDKGMGLALRYMVDSENKEVQSIIGDSIKDTTVGVSFLSSNDHGNADGINANILAVMLDLKTVYEGIEFGSYFSKINLDDRDSSTKDGVTAFMIYASKTLSGYFKHGYTIAGRYSITQPDEYNGSGTGITALLPNLGLSNKNVSDADSTRLQLSGILHVNDDINIHNELILDIYGKNLTDYNNTGLLSYVSLTF